MPLFHLYNNGKMVAGVRAMSRNEAWIMVPSILWKMGIDKNKPELKEVEN